MSEAWFILNEMENVVDTKMAAERHKIEKIRERLGLLIIEKSKLKELRTALGED